MNMGSSCVVLDTITVSNSQKSDSRHDMFVAVSAATELVLVGWFHPHPAHVMRCVVT